MSDKKDYPRPSLTADVVVVTMGDPERVPAVTQTPPLAPGAEGARSLRVLFVRRARDPFAGSWALPGGFVEPTETVAEAAVRELGEETSLSGVPVEEIGCFSKPGRDPRGWVVTVAHLAIVPVDRLGDVKAADDAAAAEWLDLTTAGGQVLALTRNGEPVGKLAFDHDEILAAAVKRFFLREGSA